MGVFWDNKTKTWQIHAHSIIFCCIHIFALFVFVQETGRSLIRCRWELSVTSERMASTRNSVLPQLTWTAIATAVRMLLVQLQHMWVFFDYPFKYQRQRIVPLWVFWKHVMFQNCNILQKYKNTMGIITKQNFFVSCLLVTENTWYQAWTFSRSRLQINVCLRPAGTWPLFPTPRKSGIIEVESGEPIARTPSSCHVSASKMLMNKHFWRSQVAFWPTHIKFFSTSSPQQHDLLVLHLIISQ